MQSDGQNVTKPRRSRERLAAAWAGTAALFVAAVHHGGGVSASATTLATASLTGCSSHPGGDCDTPINQSSSN